MHASEAAALFFPADEDDEEVNYNIDGDDQGVDGWDSSGGSPVDEEDQDIIPVRYILI